MQTNTVKSFIFRTYTKTGGRGVLGSSTVFRDEPQRSFPTRQSYSPFSGDVHLHARPVDPHRQQLSARRSHSFLHSLPCVWLNQQHYATAAARATHFSGQRALLPRI